MLKKLIRLIAFFTGILGICIILAFGTMLFREISVYDIIGLSMISLANIILYGFMVIEDLVGRGKIKQKTHSD